MNVLEYDIDLPVKSAALTSPQYARAMRLSAVQLDRWLLIAAVAVGLFLRVWQLNAVGFNSDEAVYAGQAAAIVGDEHFAPYFPMFRAHPMLFHTVLATVFYFGVNDLMGRLVAVAFGIANIYFVFKIGQVLYTPRIGAIAALFVALMPYHVIVSRQLLLDGPMTTLATLTLLLLAHFGQTERARYLYATGAAMGLTFLIKETAVVLMGSIYMFLALASDRRVRIRDLFVSLLCLVAVAAAHPLAPRLAGAGGAKKTGHYLIWQLFRRPNHDWLFYPTTVTMAMGPLLIGAALLALWLLRKSISWRELLLIAWIAVPTIFFQLWPVKGFHYLLTNTAPVALLAALLFSATPTVTPQWRFFFPQWRTIALLIVALSLLLSSWSWLQTSKSDTVMAGGGGVPGGREVGAWISEHVPSGAVFMTLGPSMANIIQFYGHRRAYGLSVSPNPLHRNPSYEPILNPDYQLRTGELQYLVWDSFSAARSDFFATRLLDYVDRYHGYVVHRQFVALDQPTNNRLQRHDETACIADPVHGYLCPTIIIYEVRP